MGVYSRNASLIPVVQTSDPVRRIAGTARCECKDQDVVEGHCLECHSVCTSRNASRAAPELTQSSLCARTHFTNRNTAVDITGSTLKEGKATVTMLLTFIYIVYSFHLSIAFDIALHARTKLACCLTAALGVSSTLQYICCFLNGFQSLPDCHREDRSRDGCRHHTMQNA